MGPNMNEMLNLAKELNALGIASDDTVKTIEECKRIGDLKRVMPKEAKPMTGDEIKALRQRWGLSQSMLAYTLCMSVGSISKWERGEKKPSGLALRVLHSIAEKGPGVLMAD
ncbi:helix-turn-helix domain-containing protein (plasmid) [Citrobacter portucalensis]|uniref:helix-turn-helix domain-containing protein n=1 Tax=Citrobacter portucalensis TaxID=1639133 RepID=UPI00351D700A